MTGVLGYMAMSVPEGQGFGNLTFLVVMVALTLIAVVVAVVHPIAWTDDEMRFAVIAPAALGALVFFGALAIGRLDAQVVVGGFAITPLAVGPRSSRSGSLAVYVVFTLAGRFGFGPLAAPPGPDDPAYGLEPPAPPADGWLRPGWLLGLPVAWMAICLAVLPLAVYVVSYIPWAMVESHQIVAGWPPGHTGQTLLDLTGQMYGYHNALTTPHPASSPWWAWPLDLKPVWFYQEGLAAGTSAAIYDAGQPRDLVAGRAGAALRERHGLPAAEPGARADRGRVRRPVDPVGAHRPGRVPVPLLHGAAVRGRWRSPTSSRSCGTAPRGRHGGWPGSRAPRPSSCRPRCGCSPGRCARSSGSNRSTRARRPAPR